jgi:hypothetical protein
MHAIGTRVLFDSRTTVGYAMNNKVLQPVLKSFVEALLSVVQHMEADTSFLPISPMNGNGIGLCVGDTINTSVNLGNSSHLDLNDGALQGFSVFTEEKPECTSKLVFCPSKFAWQEIGWFGIQWCCHPALSWDGYKLGWLCCATLHVGVSVGWGRDSMCRCWLD